MATRADGVVKFGVGCGLCLLIGAAGCGGAKPAPTGGGADGPAWMARGSGAFATERGRAFFGVASGSGQSPALRRKDADARSRAALAQALDAYAAKVAKLAAAGDAAAEQAITGALHNLGQSESASARVVDHLVKDGAESAVAMEELESFKAALDKSDLPQDKRDAVKASAEAAFDAPDAS